MKFAAALCLVIAAFIGSAQAATPIVNVPSIAALQALDGSHDPVVDVSGFYDGSLKGGGMFIWQAASTTAPDNCTIFAARSDQTGGRWVRRMGNNLDVTMCGAKWDNATDDAAAVSAAFTAASRGGFTLTCPPGAGLIASTVAPASFDGVTMRCQGMTASILRCAVAASKPCFLFQNAKGTDEIAAPQIFDLGIMAPGAGVVIQYNSVDGGFTDSGATQSYMMRPIVQRVAITGGAIAVQCSKCFDGDFSLDKLAGQARNGFDLEGSDWMSIGDAGSNRIVATGGVPIRLASHGTFGNGDYVIHNDILAPARGTEAYIYSSARTSYIEKNFFEGISHGPCEIKIDIGASHATVRDNHVTDPTVDHWLCVVPLLRQAEFSDNQTTSHGQGSAFFANRGTWKDFLLRHAITHFGNWSEDGFPGLWSWPMP